MLNRVLRLDFSRKDYTGPPIKKLIDVINHVKPTALLGLSTVKVCRGTKKASELVLKPLRVGCIRRSSGQAHVRTEPETDNFPVV